MVDKNEILASASRFLHELKGEPAPPPPPPKQTPLDQDRKVLRLNTSYPLTVVLDKKHMVAGSVLDIGVSGARLRLPCFAMPNSEIWLRDDRPHNEGVCAVVRARVVWCVRRPDDTIEAGVAYTESKTVMAKSWVKHLLFSLGLTPDRIYDRRRHVRVRCEIKAQAIDAHAEAPLPVKGQLLDLSMTGAHFEGNRELHPRQEISLEVRRDMHEVMRWHGTVMRRMRSERTPYWKTGIRFEQSPGLEGFLNSLIRQN
jgi:hypothetical protein